MAPGFICPIGFTYVHWRPPCPFKPRPALVKGCKSVYHIVETAPLFKSRPPITYNLHQINIKFISSECLTSWNTLIIVTFLKSNSWTSLKRYLIVLLTCYCKRKTNDTLFFQGFYREHGPHTSFRWNLRSFPIRSCCLSLLPSVLRLCYCWCYSVIPLACPCLPLEFAQSISC